MDLKAVFQNIVGQAGVSDAPEILAGFSRDHSFVPEMAPALVVWPGSAEDIAAIIQAAREHNIALVPVSSGPPHFRGDSVPSVPGAVVVDMSGMKKIEWINRRNRVAVVEPGVTFGELSPELEKQGMRAMVPLMPRATKSIVGAFMEREPFTVPKYSWDLADPVASMEILLGDGKTMRTGGASGPGKTLEDQRRVDGAQKLPLSPVGMDLRRMAQGSCGSLGICSWMSVRCELLPEHEKAYFIAGDDIAALMEPLRRFHYLRLVDEHYVVNGLTFACLVKTDPVEITRLARKLPPWIMVLSVGGYGELAEDQFKYKDADVKEEAKNLGLRLETKGGGLTEEQFREMVFRKVSPEPYWKLRKKGDCREVFFLTPPARFAPFYEKAASLAKKYGFAFEDIGIYLQPVVQGNTLHCEFDLFMEPAEAPMWDKFYVELSRALFEMGGYFSRPYGPWSDIVYPRYETFSKYARGIKKIFDPQGIMNPEKLCFKGM